MPLKNWEKEDAEDDDYFDNKAQKTMIVVGEKIGEYSGDAMDLDDFHQMGKYTLLVCLFAELTILTQVGNMLFMAYAGAAPTLVGCGGGHKFTEGQSANQRCAQLAKMLHDERNMPQGCTNSSGVELNAQFLSVNMDFRLYCQTQLVKATISYQMVGVILGTIVFGHLSDCYGRKRIMQWALVGCILAMLTTTMATNLLQFTIARFVANFFNAGTMVVLNVFTSEHYPKANRFCLPNLISWAPNFVVFALMAWLTGDWRTLHRFSAFLALPAVCLLHYLNESPHFLMQSRRLDEAKAAILRMHRIDGRPCDENNLDLCLKKHMVNMKNAKKYNYLHLFHNVRFTRYTLAISLSFFVYAILDYSLLFNMEKLSGSIYLNAIFMGLTRFGLHLSVAFLEMRFKQVGRKVVHLITEILAVLALSLCAISFLFDLQHHPLLLRSSVFIVSFSPLLFIANTLANNELFPTAVRNTAYSFGQLFCRIGVALAPQLFLMSTIADWLPYFLLMILSTGDATFFQFNITETRGKPLFANFPSKEGENQQKEANSQMASLLGQREIGTKFFDEPA